MDEPEVTRVIALVFGERVNDSNPVAAMPSMHVAFPLVIGLWFTRERWYGPAALMIGYSGLISSEVVFSGEHYIIDVLAAGVVAILVATVASLNYQPIRARIGRVLFAERRLVLDPVPIARSAREGERGQTLVEMAFALPVILVFVMLMVDIGFAVDRREVVQHGVREGARYGAVGNSAAAITTHANQESGGTLSSVQVCYIDENGNGNPGNAGDTVRVTGQYTYDFMIGNGTFFDGAFPSVSMTPSSQARLEKSVPFASDC
jgi:Flp pilus assembly protein TadG